MELKSLFLLGATVLVLAEQTQGIPSPHLCSESIVGGGKIRSVRPLDSACWDPEDDSDPATNETAFLRPAGLTDETLHYDGGIAYDERSHQVSTGPIFDEKV